MGFVGTKCCQCGYTRCVGALEFHHNGDKKFGISRRIGKNKINTLDDLQEDIIRELQKCVVLCANCHKIQHNDGFFESHKMEIYEKSFNMLEKTKTNPELIVGLRKQGLTEKEIAVKCGCSYLRVYEILRANKMQTTRKNKLVILDL